MLRLRNIELSGFKSFADRTSIPLPEDVLVIVGPNGSGKSNITDAILWALGEQSAKVLRGRKMQDVIFGGSRKRQSAGSTEVMLTFEFSEGRKVRIGRRLVRTGESSYLMDGRSVRLKDVHDFILRNGISKQGSFLVEQGRVEALLSASPEERRLIFEEVAGIAHYKENRKSALQKLGAAEGNLLRLTDVISEVDQQRRALKRQAAQADRYVKLTEELLERKKVFWGRACARFSARKSDLDRECSLLRSERERRTALLNRRQADLEQAREKLNAHEVSLQTLVKSLHDNELLLERIENENKRRTDRILASRQRIRQIVVDREELDGRVKAARETHGKLAAKVRLLEEKSKKAAVGADEAASRLEAAREEVLSAEKELETLRSEAFEQAQARSNYSTNLQRLSDDIKRQASRKARMAREEEELASRLEAAAETLKRFNDDVASAREMVEKNAGEREKQEKLLSEKRSILKGAKENLERARTSRAVAERGLEVLLESESSLRSSAHAFLSERAAKRVKKTLAAYLAPAPEALVAPLVSVLGDLLEGYTDQEWKGLPEVLSLLREKKAGQAVFFLKDRRVRRKVNVQDFPGFNGWLDEVPDLPPELKNILPTVAMVESPDDALTFASLHEIPAVTGNGVYVSPDGWVRGGSGGGSGGASVLEFERKKRSAEDEIEKLREVVLTTGRAVENALSEVDEASIRLNSALEAEKSSAVELAALERKLEEAVREEKRLDASRELLEDEAIQVEEETASLLEQRLDFEKLLKESEQSRKDLERRTKECESSIEKARENLEAAHEAVAVSRADMGETTQALEGTMSAAATSAERLEELLETGMRLDAEKASLEKKIADLTGEVTGGDRELRDVLLKIDDQRENRARYEENLVRFGREVKECEEHVEEARATLEQVREELSELERELASVNAELRSVSERIGESLEESVEELVALYSDGEPLGEEEGETMQASISRLEEKIARMGAVNLQARERYDELKTRWEFLNGQKKDLEDSVASLRETINKINKTSKERFMEAFNAVGEHFAHLFREVFEGGEARLSLLDENDPLETGVEVYAQPPGKKLQSLQLLSGGEKAMVALALLFGLFLYRPQPFFILDEVDAPLDEANINRFSRLLTRFRGQTQFIIVSHNKRTMEIGQLLYGVTMSESGVSRIVSVRIADVEKELQ